MSESKEITELRGKLFDTTQALKAIKTHMEISVPEGHKLSAVWFIASRTLIETGVINSD